MVYKVIEIICGIVFVFTGILKLIDLGNTSQYFAFIFELNYSLIQLLLIFLSLLEITIGFSLVVGIWQMSAVYYSIISLLLFFILIDIYFYMMGISNCGCAGTKIIIGPVASGVKNIILIMLLIFAKNRTLKIYKMKS